MKRWSDRLVLAIDAVREELGIAELEWQTSDFTRERVIAIAKSRVKNVD